MHLAALIAIPYSYIAPQSYVDVNVTGTLNVVSAAQGLWHREGGAHLHFRVSTAPRSSCRSPKSIRWWANRRMRRARSPRIRSRLSFHRSFDLPVTIARPFNTYGPRQSARAVIPTMIRRSPPARPRSSWARCSRRAISISCRTPSTG